ncbi:MAG: hypothetical protein JWM31_2934 [Solirubrobacterales bacterium]|nr:hypothetical protein [Solirubrobacterales bacterium]
MSFPIGTPPGASTGIQDLSGPASRAPAPGVPGTPGTGGPTFARVYELEEARRRRDVPIPRIAGDRIPAEVWDEVEAAAKLFDQLKAEGRQVMFDNDRLSGKVVASLLGPDGAVDRLPLTQAVDPQQGPPPTPPPAGVLAAYGRAGTT